MNAERNKRCFFLVFVFAIAANLLLGLSVGIRLFAVIALLFTTSKVLWDWKKRSWKYVGAARFDYVLKSLTSVIAIILLTWFYLLPRHPILWLAVPLVAIYIPVAITKCTQKINQWGQGLICGGSALFAIADASASKNHLRPKKGTFVICKSLDFATLVEDLIEKNTGSDRDINGVTAAEHR